MIRTNERGTYYQYYPLPLRQLVNNQRCPITLQTSNYWLRNTADLLLFRQSLTLIGRDEDKISVHVRVLTRPVLCTWCIVRDHSAYFRGRCTVSEAHPVNCIVLCACIGRVLLAAARAALLWKWHQVNTSVPVRQRRSKCVARDSVTTYFGVSSSTHVDTLPAKVSTEYSPVFCVWAFYNFR